MSWTCAGCGSENADSSKICDGCGEFQAGVLSLCGTLKTLTMSNSVEVGRVLYSRLVGAESRFVDSKQYHLVKSEESGWCLLAFNGKTTQLTLLNGGECIPDQLYPLNDGDCIEIGSRSNGNKIAAVKIQMRKK